MLVNILAILLYFIIIDFIIKLPNINRLNILLIITSKFTKKVLLELGKDT